MTTNTTAPWVRIRNQGVETPLHEDLDRYPEIAEAIRGDLDRNLDQWYFVARDFGVSWYSDEITYGHTDTERDVLDDDGNPTGEKVWWRRYWAERLYTRTCNCGRSSEGN